jgi:hypothetical protein
MTARGSAVRDDGPIVREITAAVYVIPTDAPEADGTFTWDQTIMVLVSARAGTARTSSIFTITSGLSGCSSTAPWTPAAGS